MATTTTRAISSRWQAGSHPPARKTIGTILARTPAARPDSILPTLMSPVRAGTILDPRRSPRAVARGAILPRPGGLRPVARTGYPDATLVIRCPRETEGAPVRHPAPTPDFTSPTPPSSVIIENVWPELDCGRYPIKREVGDVLDVWAD